MRSPLLRAAFITLAAAVSARAQTPAPDDARRQVEQLSAQVRDLTVRLAEAQRQIELLEADRAELLASLREAKAALEAARSVGGVPLIPRQAPTPRDPYASPASMRAELIRRYLAEVASLPTADATDPAQREEHQRSVDRWCRLSARLLRGRATWTIILDDLRPAEDGRPREEWTARVTVVDDATRLPIGESFRSSLPSRLAQRVAREARQRTDPEPRLWRATVTLSAEPAFNARRVEPGPWDTPPFIGRYAEFRYTVEWHAIAPADAPKEQPEPPPGR